MRPQIVLCFFAVLGDQRTRRAARSSQELRAEATGRLVCALPRLLMWGDASYRAFPFVYFCAARREAEVEGGTEGWRWRLPGPRAAHRRSSN